MFSELEFQRQSAAADATVAPAPTDRELVEVVALAALEVRRTRKRLEKFRAGTRGYAQAMEVPLAAFNRAVEQLAELRGDK